MTLIEIINKITPIILLIIIEYLFKKFFEKSKVKKTEIIQNQKQVAKTIHKPYIVLIQKGVN